MNKKLTSITLEDYFSQDLAKEIVDYILKKGIKKVKITISEELKEPIEKTYSSDKFNLLESEIINSLDSDGYYFSLEIPEIKTSWEEFTYGVEANSYQEDFKEVFSKYE